ncbi:hypothetical protein DM02DRAFT_632650 [Periconia macrospinosa]|uniref:Uncharacterized protein n=1 Tax=Periconia macrospinosa TaxID=97972 RepID=A0A2V1DEY3_9PLEO|nr:hypothetical protein DM02DRAFT_632650 [Periconia macrospinosa]
MQRGQTPSRYEAPVKIVDKLTPSTLCNNRTRPVLENFLHKYCSGISALIDDIPDTTKKDLAYRVHDVIVEWEREAREGIRPEDRLWKWRVDTDRFVPFVDGLDAIAEEDEGSEDDCFEVTRDGRRIGNFAVDGNEQMNIASEGYGTRVVGNPTIDLTDDNNKNDDDYPILNPLDGTINPALLTSPPPTTPQLPPLIHSTTTNLATLIYASMHPKHTGVTYRNPTRVDDIKTRLAEYISFARYPLVHNNKRPYLTREAHARLVKGIYSWPCFFVIEHYVQELVRIEVGVGGGGVMGMEEWDEVLVRYGVNAGALEEGIVWGGLEWGVGVEREKAAREVVRDCLRFCWKE